jgi:hypothetical protein
MLIAIAVAVILFLWLVNEWTETPDVSVTAMFEPINDPRLMEILNDHKRKKQIR